MRELPKAFLSLEPKRYEWYLIVDLYGSSENDERRLLDCLDKQAELKNGHQEILMTIYISYLG